MNISREELETEGFWRGGTVYPDAATTLRVQIDRDVHGFVVYIMIVNDEFMKAGKTETPFSTRMRIRGELRADVALLQEASSALNQSYIPSSAVT